VDQLVEFGVAGQRLANFLNRMDDSRVMLAAERPSDFWK
jgi:hypothetical protein